MKVIAKGKIETVLDRLAENADVFVPMQRGPQTGFFSWKSFDDYNDDLMLDILNVYLPPKNIVLSPTEKLCTCRPEGAEIDNSQLDKEMEAKIIFGIRGCDVQAISELDQILLSQGNENRYYQTRRDRTILVASACYYPGASCFCTSMGGNPTEVAAADIIIHDVGADGYVWEAKTEKGQIITDKIADLLEEKQITLPEPKPLSRKVDDEGVAEKLQAMFEHPLWEKYSEPCHTCGICTFTCPSCNCFDMQSQNWGEEGCLFTCYDSCMYRGHTLMASRDNPGAAALERFRNRFLHKLQFYPERYGKTLCTGCGRCIALCPAGYSIVKIIAEVKEADLGV